MTQSVKLKLSIARALIANPEILLLERTIQGLNEECAMQVLDVLRQHVDDKGLCKPEGKTRRRPRDVFFSTEYRALAAKADAIIEIDPKNKTMEMNHTTSHRKKRRD